MSASMLLSTAAVIPKEQHTALDVPRRSDDRVHQVCGKPTRRFCYSLFNFVETK